MNMKSAVTETIKTLEENKGFGVGVGNDFLDVIANTKPTKVKTK